MLVDVARRWKSEEADAIVVLIALLALYSGLRWMMMSGEAAPPGSDGGNWLAFSRELFGDNVKAADAACPPVFLLLLRSSLSFLSPLVALKVLGLVTAASLSIPAYLLLRTAVGSWLAALLAAAVAVMDYHNEVLAWGGYPQLLGAAFLLLSVYLLLQGLYTGKLRFFAGSAVCTGLTVATHTLSAVQLALALAALLAIHAYGRRGVPASPPRRHLGRLLLFWVVTTGVLTLAVVPFYVKTIGLWAGNPANPHEFNLLEFLGTFGSWHSENYMWLAAAVVGGAATWWAVLARRRLFLAEAVAALLVSSILGFVFLQEIRSAHLLQVGLLLSVGVVAALATKEMVSWLAGVGRRKLRFLAIAFVVAFVCGVLLFGQWRAQLAFDWYRVVDNQVLAALDWVQDRGSPGDRVIANETPGGGILGWWVEGYVGLPTYHAVDARWLSFRQEKEQAEVAHRFLSPDTEPSELRRMAETYEVRFLLLHKETLDNELSNLLEAGFVSGFENQTMIVLTNGEARPAR